MNEDFLDLLTALNAVDARFLVVGAYAVGIHGRPRATKDLDVWIEASHENAALFFERYAISVRRLPASRDRFFATWHRVQDGASPSPHRHPHAS